MRRRADLFLCLLGLALLAACARPHPEPISGLVPAELPRAGQWWSAETSCRIRQEVLFSFSSRNLPMTGVLDLDLGPPERRRARLAALNELGVTLFDIEVRESGSVLHRAVPDLERIPGFEKMVAACLRRVLAWDAPQTAWAPQDASPVLSPTVYLEAPMQGSRSFAFAGPAPDLASQERRLDGEDWRVDYEEYSQSSLGRFPERIRYVDRRAGYALTLWNRNVRIMP